MEPGEEGIPEAMWVILGPWKWAFSSEMPLIEMLCPLFLFIPNLLAQICTSLKWSKFSALEQPPQTATPEHVISQLIIWVTS